MPKNLLFLHGFATNSEIWDLQITEFSKDYRVFAFDLDLSSIANSVSFLDSFIRKQKLENICIVGWSMGAFVAIKLYFKILEGKTLDETVPDKKILDKLVLVGATPKFIASEDFPFGLSGPIFKSFEKRLKTNYQGGIKFFHNLIFNNERDISKVKGLNIPDKNPALKALHELATVDVRQMLPEIEIPVLLIHGEEDQICLPAAAKYMTEEIPDVKLEIIENCAHAPLIENPERFNQILREYAG